MQIGEVIRKYRKEKDMTQEEMARALGVTAPAVNKWENGNSLPDVMLLAPIARLLEITLDTLLSYQEALTEEEINGMICEMGAKLKKEPYEEVFQWAKKKWEQFPNCEKLFLNMAMVLDARRLMEKVPDSEKYDDALTACYNRALESRDENIRYGAADALFNFYMREERYDKAEEYLTRFSARDPEKKRKQARIYAETGRIKEAYKAYEEMLFNGYQMMSIVLNGIYQLAANEEDREKVQMITAIQRKLAGVLERGEYEEIVWELEPIVRERDADAAISIMERLLASIGTIDSYAESRLYEHMGIRKMNEASYDEMKQILLKTFRSEEVYDWLKENERWQTLFA